MRLNHLSRSAGRGSGSLSWRSLAVVLLAAAVPTAGAAAVGCTASELSALAVPNITITSATAVPAASPTPAYCEVIGTVATSGEGVGPGSADFRLRLPSSWSSRFLFMGSGGLAGSLNPSVNAVDNAISLQKGYATVVTTTGHTNTDPVWMFNPQGGVNDPRIIDYYYRATHQVGIAARALVNAFYGSPIHRAYFDGCSNGGKMGLLEAMRYPEDYDGIIVGAPWLDPLGTSLWALKNARALLRAYIPPETLARLEAAVTASCDALDGVKDGLIQNPAACSFDPQTLVPGTLTQAQADAVRTVLRPVVDSNGGVVYPGSSVSNLGEPGAGFGLAAAELLTGQAPNPTAALPWGAAANGAASGPGDFTLAIGIVRNLGFLDPSYDIVNGVFQGDVLPADTRDLLYGRLAQDIPSDPRRLRAFFDKGGKMLFYHGWSDPIISPYRTVWFYDELVQAAGGFRKAWDFARLFMVPGMQHCGGGSFPNAFDTLTPLEQWVENGQSPDNIVATHLTNNVADRTMPLCKYPEQARYDGSGDVKVASNWFCPGNDRSQLQIGLNGLEAAGQGSGRTPSACSAGDGHGKGGSWYGQGGWYDQNGDDGHGGFHEDRR